MKIIPHYLPREPFDDPADLPRTAPPAWARAASASATALLPGIEPHPVRITPYAEGYTPDGHGVVGPLPGQDNATVLTRFSGHGFKLGPVFDDIAADLVLTGKPSTP